MAKTKKAETRHRIDLNSEEFRSMHREASVDRAGINKEERTVELSFASETPVERWFGREILDITSDAVDMTRLNSGAALLLNHDWDRQVGSVVKAWVDGATKKARAIVKFSRSQAGEDIFNDIEDGVRSLISVGYVVRKMVLQSVDGDVETHRVTDWMPFEISVVAVPADASVGVGRSGAPSDAQRAPAIITSKTTSMTDEEKQAKEAQERAAQERKENLASERKRIADINAAADTIAARHPQHKDKVQAFARKCAETGDGLDVFNRAILMDVLGGDNGQAAAPAVRQESGLIGMKERDLKRYSVLRAIRCKLDNKPLDGLERECSDELANKLERQPLGFFLPDDVVYHNRQKRTLLAGSAPDGGYTVATDLMTSEFVELLRNQTRVAELGARFMGGLKGDVAIPRQVTGATVSWASETGTLSASSATFGQIVGRPRRVGSSVPYSRQFLAQTSLSAEAFVIEDSDRAMAVELDRVAINGAGGDTPLGILNLATATRADSVTFSAAPTWAKYLDFFAQVAEANAILGNPAYLSTPASYVKAASIPKFANTATPIWDNDMVGTFRARWSNQFPSGDKVIFGDFSQIIYLEWLGRDVVVDPYGTNATNGTVTITIQRMIDMIIRQGKAFSISTDSGAQ